MIYQRGRARWARGDIAGARRDFEAALGGGYRAAAIDLAQLFLQSPAYAESAADSSSTPVAHNTSAALPPDLRRAVSLLVRAWHDGVSIAAFDLGELYERGVRRADSRGSYWLAPDAAWASAWYRRGAGAGEPNALARLAEREEEIAYTGGEPADSRAHLLTAFRYYAAAAEQARREDWPDGAWKRWRYQRASLARRLAHADMMRKVAAAYDAVLRRASRKVASSCRSDTRCGSTSASPQVMTGP